MSQVNLSILKKLMASLEEQIKIAEDFKDGSSADYITELSKASGIAVGLANEATFIMGDLQLLARKASNPATSPSPSDLMEKLWEKISNKN